MLESEDGVWTYFDMVPEEWVIREGSAEYRTYLRDRFKLDEAKLGAAVVLQEIGTKVKKMVILIFQHRFIL